MQAVLKNKIRHIIVNVLFEQTEAVQFPTQVLQRLLARFAFFQSDSAANWKKKLFTVMFDNRDVPDIL